MTEIKEYEGTDYESLIFKGKFRNIQFDSKDSNGNVELYIEDGDHNSSQFLTQENLKTLIEFLSKQITP